MKKGGVYSMEIPLHTIRIVIKDGVKTEPVDYFKTKEEAERIAANAFERHGYKTSVQLENIKVQVKI